MGLALQQQPLLPRLVGEKCDKGLDFRAGPVAIATRPVHDLVFSLVSVMEIACNKEVARAGTRQFKDHDIAFLSSGAEK